MRTIVINISNIITIMTIRARHQHQILVGTFHIDSLMTYLVTR